MTAPEPDVDLADIDDLFPETGADLPRWRNPDHHVALLPPLESEPGQSTGDPS